MYKRITSYLICMVFMQMLSANDNRFVLSGKIDPELNGKQVKLIIYENNKFKTLDSTMIANGQFSFAGTEYPSEMSKLLVAGFFDYDMRVFLERGNIAVNVGKNFWEYSVAGTPLNNLYQAYNDSCTFYKRKVNDMLAKGDGGRLTENGIQVYADGNASKVYYQWGAYAVNFKRKNITNPVGKGVFKDELNKFRLNETIWSHGTDSAFTIIYNLADERLKADSLVMGYRRKVEKEKKQQEFVKSLTGKAFPNIDLLSLDGKKQSFTPGLAGKADYLLIDFWASWCNPCIGSMPALKETYAKYQSKGLEIIGISLDADPGSWKKGLERINTPWQHFKLNVYATKKENELLQKKLYESCGLSGVPYMVLLDKNGKILSVGHISDDYLSTLLDKKD